MWPIDRREQLIHLQNLVRECAQLNEGNHIIERLSEIINLAGLVLTSTDDWHGVKSFMGFLEDEATKKSAPGGEEGK